jgi:hypothetical protein
MNTRPLLPGSETRFALYYRFVAGISAPQIEGLSSLESEIVNGTFHDLKARGCDTETVDAVVKKTAAVFRLARAEVKRLAEKFQLTPDLLEKLSLEVARRTVFGPGSSEGDAVFRGVPFIALMPHAVRAVDPSQRDERDSSRLVVPSFCHQWHWEAAHLSRVSVQTVESLHHWIDMVVMSGGVPKIVVFTCVEQGRSDALPEGKSPFFDIEITDEEHLLRAGDNWVPEGLDEFFKMVRSSDSLKMAYDLLSLDPYW